MTPISLYIHIPFCERKCAYCTFTSFCAHNQEKDEYINLLCKEIVSRKRDGEVRTIYIGGGTPTTLSSSQIAKIITTIQENFDLKHLEEFTIEANPNSLTEELLRTYKTLGVNRVSIGVQTLSNKALKKIGRLHTKKEALRKIKLAKYYFDNISADLIIGLEDQTKKMVCRHVKKIIKAGAKHISCYLLEVYENTPLFEKIKENLYKPLTDEKTIQIFNELSKCLERHGFVRYEISNFGKNDHKSKHNLNYWARGEYLGFGISAYSFIDGKRIQNADNIKDYANGVATTEELTSKDEIEEIIMLGLRCENGVDVQMLTQKGYDITKNAYYEQYLEEKILISANTKLFLNPKYYHISNTIISNLLPD